MQIIVLALLPKGLDSSGANYAKNLLRAVILVQYIPRLFRFIPLLIGQSPNGFIFETASANFFINLFTFVLSGHIIGSCWYLFGLQVSRSHYVLKYAGRALFLSTFFLSFEYPKTFIYSVTIPISLLEKYRVAELLMVHFFPLVSPSPIQEMKS